MLDKLSPDGGARHLESRSSALGPSQVLPLSLCVLKEKEDRFLPPPLSLLCCAAADCLDSKTEKDLKNSTVTEIIKVGLRQGLELSVVYLTESRFSKNVLSVFSGQRLIKHTKQNTAGQPFGFTWHHSRSVTRTVLYFCSSGRHIWSYY